MLYMEYMNSNEIKDLSYFLIPNKQQEFKEFYSVYRKYNYFLEDNLCSRIFKEISNISDFEIVVKDCFMVAIPSNFNYNNLVIVNSHVDNVYKKCFIKKEKNYYLGTFDNGIGIYTLLKQIKNNIISNIAYSFTDCEETNMQGIKDLHNYITNRFNNCKISYIILDVTEENVDESTTIENCNIDFPIIDDIIKIENEHCGYDEAAFLLENSVSSVCSVCCTLKMRDINDNCHNPNGNYLLCNNINRYCCNVNYIINFVSKLLFNN